MTALVYSSTSAATFALSERGFGAASGAPIQLDMRIEYVHAWHETDAPPACPLDSREVESLVFDWASGSRVNEARRFWLQLRSFVAPEAQVSGDAAVALAELREKWHRFIEGLPSDDPRMTREHVAAVRSFLDAADQGPRRLPPAVTQASDGGPIHLAWSRGNHYLDVDVFPDGTFEWFYKDRSTGAFEGTETDREAKISDALRARLRAVTG